MQSLEEKNESFNLDMEANANLLSLYEKTQTGRVAAVVSAVTRALIEDVGNEMIDCEWDTVADGIYPNYPMSYLLPVDIVAMSADNRTKQLHHRSVLMGYRSQKEIVAECTRHIESIFSRHHITCLMENDSGASGVGIMRIRVFLVPRSFDKPVIWLGKTAYTFEDTVEAVMDQFNTQYQARATPHDRPEITLNTWLPIKHDTVDNPAMFSFQELEYEINRQIEQTMVFDGLSGVYTLTIDERGMLGLKYTAR